MDFDNKKLRLRLYLGGNYGRDSADHKTPQRVFIEVCSYYSKTARSLLFILELDHVYGPVF